MRYQSGNPSNEQALIIAMMQAGTSARNDVVKLAGIGILRFCEECAALLSDEAAA
jgi:hypothetical protein